MALSMDEQRALAEIERRLAADDPGLATCLTAFRRPGPARVLRSPRVRIIGSLFTVLLVAMVSLMVYAMIPFRAHTPRPATTQTAQTQTEAAISAGGTGASGSTHSTASAGTSASAITSATSPARSATPTAGLSAGTSPAQPAASQAAGHDVVSPATGP
jgi:hypothetical protein